MLKTKNTMSRRLPPHTHTDYSSLNLILPVSINKLKTSSCVIITAKIIEISEGKLVEIYDQTSIPQQTNFNHLMQKLKCLSRSAHLMNSDCCRVWPHLHKLAVGVWRSVPVVVTQHFAQELDVVVHFLQRIAAFGHLLHSGLVLHNTDSVCHINDATPDPESVCESENKTLKIWSRGLTLIGFIQTPQMQPHLNH